MKARSLSFSPSAESPPHTTNSFTAADSHRDQRQEGPRVEALCERRLRGTLNFIIATDQSQVLVASSVMVYMGSPIRLQWAMISFQGYHRSWKTRITATRATRCIHTLQPACASCPRSGASRPVRKQTRVARFRHRVAVRIGKRLACGGDHNILNTAGMQGSKWARDGH